MHIDIILLDRANWFMKNIFNLKNLILLFQGAMVGTGAILSGVSGGVLCVAFGIYEPMTVGTAALDFGGIVPLIIGLLITVILFARLFNSLFKKHYALVSRIILGIVIASSLKMVPTSFASVWTLILSIVCFVTEVVICFI